MTDHDRAIAHVTRALAGEDRPDVVGRKFDLNSALSMRCINSKRVT